MTLFIVSFLAFANVNQTYAAQIQLAECQTLACVKSKLEESGEQNPNLNDCAILDKKIDAREFDGDLGSLCRLSMSRVLVKKRKKSSCTGDSDYETALSSKPLLKINQSILKKYVLKKNEKFTISGGYNNSTIHDSYVFNQWYDVKGKGFNLAVYFCISDKPKKYVPYFYAWEENKKILQQGYIEKF